MQTQEFLRKNSDTQENTDRIINLKGNPKVPWLIRYNIDEAVSSYEPAIDFTAINVGYFLIAYGTLDKQKALTDPLYHLKLKLNFCRMTSSEYSKLLQTKHMTNTTHVASNRIKDVMKLYSQDPDKKSVVDNYNEYIFLKRILSLICVLSSENSSCDEISPEDREKIKSSYKHMILKIPFFLQKMYPKNSELNSITDDILRYQKSINAENEDEVQIIVYNIRKSKLYLNNFVTTAYNSLFSSYLYPDILVERVINYIQTHPDIDTKAFYDEMLEFENTVVLVTNEYAKNPHANLLNKFGDVIIKSVNTGNFLNVEHEPSTKCQNRYDFNSDFECKIKELIKSKRLEYLSKKMKALNKEYLILKEQKMSSLLSLTEFETTEQDLKKKFNEIKSLTNEYNPKKREQYSVCKTQKDCVLSRDGSDDECYILWNKETEEDIDVL